MTTKYKTANSQDIDLEDELQARPTSYWGICCDFFSCGTCCLRCKGKGWTVIKVLFSVFLTSIVLQLSNFAGALWYELVSFHTETWRTSPDYDMWVALTLGGMTLVMMLIMWSDAASYYAVHKQSQMVADKPQTLAELQVLLKEISERLDNMKSRSKANAFDGIPTSKQRSRR